MNLAERMHSEGFCLNDYDSQNFIVNSAGKLWAVDLGACEKGNKAQCRSELKRVKELVSIVSSSKETGPALISIKHLSYLWLHQCQIWSAHRGSAKLANLQSTFKVLERDVENIWNMCIFVLARDPLFELPNWKGNFKSLLGKFSPSRF